MILKMLIENQRLNNEFQKEHGMSIYIETQDRKLLFDTGASGTFLSNAAKMGVNVENVDSVIISHAHSDHCGGLPGFLKVNKQAEVFISDKAQKHYYASLLLFKENVSVPGEIFKTFLPRLHFINDFTQLGDNIFLVNRFIRKYPLVRSSKDLFVRSEGKYVQDEFDHEFALVINNAGKLVIVTGCSHNGVENMIDTVVEHFPGMPLQTVIGGFHLMGFPFASLMGESRANITAIAGRLLNYKIEKTYTCHCTGKRGYRILKETMGDKLDYIYTGMQVEL